MLIKINNIVFGVDYENFSEEEKASFDQDYPIGSYEIVNEGNLTAGSPQPTIEERLEIVEQLLLETL